MLVLGLQGDRIEKQQRSIGMRSKDGFSSVSTNLLAARWWYGAVLVLDLDLVVVLDLVFLDRKSVV